MTMPQEDQPVSIYGFPDAVSAFDQRHPQWRAVMVRLGEVINLAFARTEPALNSSIDKFVFLYGNLVAEDFWELFLMVVNGYGFGAMKLLRSMYEHSVTLKYLHDHPDEVQTFIDFDRVQQYKFMKPIIDTLGVGALPSQTVAETERRYAEIKDKFMVKSCKSTKCVERHVAPTWSKLDLVSMAKKAGPMGTLIVTGYYEPLRHAHSTFRAITERLELDNIQRGLRRESQPDEADRALMVAHNCILMALEVQMERFNVPGLTEAIQDCVRDWALVWTPESLSELEAGTRGS